MPSGYKPSHLTIKPSFQMAYVALRRTALYFPAGRALLTSFTNKGGLNPNVASSLGIVDAARGITRTAPNSGSGWSIAGIAAPTVFTALKVISPLLAYYRLLI
jgi:hypothetical protein